MASLVADYGSEDENSENEDIDNEKVEIVSNSPPDPKNFLISQEESDSDASGDSSNGDNCNKSAKSLLPSPLEEKLPAPAIGGRRDAEEVTSVFSNPFEKAEMAKNSVLEQHVRMTEKAPERGIKKVCWKFKKGKCRMGKNCRYFHDQESIVVFSGGAADEDGAYQSQNPDQVYFGSGHMNQGPAIINEPEDDDNYMAGKKRKSRVGVSNNLLPPKKAMSSLSRQRESERPWTVNKS